MAAILEMYLPVLVFAFAYAGYWLLSLVMIQNPRTWQFMKRKLSRTQLTKTQRLQNVEKDAHERQPAADIDAEAPQITMNGGNVDALPPPPAPAVDAVYRKMSTLLLPLTSLVWSDLGCFYKMGGGQRTVLQGVCGSISSRQMMAIIGPSGSGKTTMMDILAGRKTVGYLQGRIQVDGKPVNKAFIKRTTYVPQDDNFVPSFTVRETMHMHAALILSRKMGREQRVQRCNEVLAVMGLSAQQNTLVGGYLPGGILLRGLSGGERKRLALSTGIVALPTVIFLDEATSGLDSTAALNVMLYMHNLAANGHVIFATIHQPSAAIWNLFDLVAVLSKGHQLYFGPQKDVVPWFTGSLGYTYDPAMHGLPSDWLLDLVNIDFDKPDKLFGSTMTSMADIEWAGQQYRDNREIWLQSFCPSQDAYDNLSGDSSPDVESVSQTETSSSQFSNDFNHKLGPNELQGMQGKSKGYVGGNTAFSQADIARLKHVMSSHDQKQNSNALCCGLNFGVGYKRASEKRSSWLMQMIVLVRRQFLVITRNPADVAGRTLVFTGLAVLVGLLFYNIDESMLSIRLRLQSQFICLMIVLLLPFVYMSLLIAEKKHYTADLSAKLYRPTAYYISKHLVTTAFSALNMFIFFFIMYGMIGFKRDAGSVWAYCGVTILFYLISCQVLELAATLMPTQDTAFQLGVVWAAVQILFSGFFIRFVGMLTWVSYIHYINAFTFAYEGAIMSQFKGQSFSCVHGFGDTAVDTIFSFTRNSIISSASPALLASARNTLNNPGADCFVSSSNIINFYGINFSYAADVGYLLIYLAVLHVLTFVTFIFMSRRERR